jgi:hypothetical protein
MQTFADHQHPMDYSNGIDSRSEPVAMVYKVVLVFIDHLSSWQKPQKLLGK